MRLQAWRLPEEWVQVRDQPFPDLKNPVLWPAGEAGHRRLETGPGREGLLPGEAVGSELWLCGNNPVP